MTITISYVSPISGPEVSDQAQDAAAAALFTACKIEDTLKKSKDILCAAYNLKLPTADHVSPDDPVGLTLHCVTKHILMLQPDLRAAFKIDCWPREIDARSLWVRL